MYFNQAKEYKYEDADYNQYYADYNGNSAWDGQSESTLQHTTIFDVGRDVVDAIASGFDEMADGLRRVVHTDFDSRQDFDFFGFDNLLGSGNFFSSGAWILPTSFFATSLLYRDQIGTVIEDLSTQIGDIVGDLPIIGNLVDTIFGNGL